MAESADPGALREQLARWTAAGLIDVDQADRIEASERERALTFPGRRLPLLAEVLGYDTAPMEGFEEDKVKALLHIPQHARVVALLAIGRRKGPDKPYGGRFDPAHTVFAEEWGRKIEF